MRKLKLGPMTADKPVKTTLELPADINRDLKAYAELLNRQSGQPIDDPICLIAPMLKHFMANDRIFRKLQRQLSQEKTG